METWALPARIREASYFAMFDPDSTPVTEAFPGLLEAVEAAGLLSAPQ